MVGNYKVITLCGSTKFKDSFIEIQKSLTLAVNIVISVGLYGHSGDSEEFKPDTKPMLDDMHKRKIDMADSIYVINVDGYIGSSTRSEIKYALITNKKIEFLYPSNIIEELLKEINDEISDFNYDEKTIKSHNDY